MKKGKKTRWLYKAAGMAVLLGAAFWCSNSGLLLWKPEVLTVLAESESGGSLSSVTEEAKILPIPNSDGKYMLKSDGFYCLNEDGSGDCVQAIHYFLYKRQTAWEAIPSSLPVKPSFSSVVALIFRQSGSICSAFAMFSFICGI